MNTIFSYVAGVPWEDLRRSRVNVVCQDVKITRLPESVQVNIPSSEKAIKVWEKVAQRLTKIAWGSSATGGIIFSVGLWKSVQDRSLLKLLGTVVLGCATGFFAWRALSVKKEAEKAKRNIEEIPAKCDSIRDAVKARGLIRFLGHANQLPGALKEQALSLFTDEEIKTLWSDWVKQVENDIGSSPQAFCNALTNGQFGLDLFYQLPEDHAMRNAAGVCIGFIGSCVLKQDEIFKKTEEELELTKKLFEEKIPDDSSNKLLTFFKRQLKEAFDIPMLSVEDTIEVSLFRFFHGHLTLLATDPVAIMATVNATTPDAIILKQILVERFYRVFSYDISQGVGIDNEYLEFVQAELEKLPDETPHKALYLSFIPKR